MRIIGIIAEYNPFHLGHLYQINKIKEMYSDSIIIAIVSPCFTERGDISIVNKWDKTNICLDNSIDLVVELPTLYATQSADIFAHGAIQILNDLGVDTLVFGTESDNIDFVNLANIQLCNKEYDILVKKYLDDGINYPSAMSRSLKDISSIKIDKPNDLLALSYVKEIVKYKYDISPISIRRTNDYHGKDTNCKVISANLIRDLISDGKDISHYVPHNSLKYINTNISLNNGYNYLIYNIINNKNNLADYLDVTEGIENKIIKSINNSDSWNDLVNNIKSKRYTYNKINRMLLHILLGIKKSDNNNENYIKILGFNSSGRNYLNRIKKTIKLPLLYGYKPNVLNILDIEFKCLYIYSLLVNDMSLISRELKNKPIIK